MVTELYCGMFWVTVGLRWMERGVRSLATSGRLFRLFFLLFQSHFKIQLPS